MSTETRTVTSLDELLETMGAWRSVYEIERSESGRIKSVTLVCVCHSSEFGRYLEYEEVKIRPLPIAEQCGSSAEGGPCILPAGHNMGQADVPSQHHWEAAAEIVTTEYHDSVVGEAQRQIHALEAQLQAAQRRELRTLELDREFLQRVADSYGIRTDEVTVAFLAKQASSRAASIEQTEADRG